MRILVVFILLAFGLLPSADNGQQSTDNRHGFRKRISETETDVGSGDGNGNPTPISDSASNIRFHESQISLADSLYKNYLPQYNFDEVKAAMEFFDSLRLSMDNGDGYGCGNGNIIPTPTPTPTSASDSAIRLQNPILLCAKAHYYHAVGLTEKDDIVGACEHYLIALEIMEEMMANDKGLRAKDKRLKAKGKKSVDCCPLTVDNNPEDYEKIRFIALIYTRLGEIFLNESCCDLAIVNYKNASLCSNVFGDNMFKSNTMKYIGNAYQLCSKQDSALFYYHKSLEYNNSIANKLDIEKCIAQIMYFDKNEHDSAFVILKNNLNKITNKNVKYSYHCLLGNLYFNDQSYDSAIYYLEESLVDSIINKKIAFTTSLSAIYDSLGDYEKKAYYDNLSATLLKNNINKEVDRSKLQTLYNNYNKRKADKEKAVAKVKTRNIVIIISIIVLAVAIFVIICIRYNHSKQNDKFKKEINDYANDINNKNIIISQKEQLVEEYKEAIEKKDEIIKKQSSEIQNFLYEKEQVTTMDFEAYYNCNICKKILNEKEERYTPLSAADLSLLVDAANENLNNIIKRLKELYPQLNNNDMYYICLSMLNISVNGISYLMGRTRKTAWLRIKTIKSYMNLNDKDDMLTFLKSIQ